MIINNSNAFISQLDRGVRYFKIAYCILCLIPAVLFGFLVLVQGPPRGFPELIITAAMFFGYFICALFIYRLILIGFEFMKSIVSTTLDCFQELKQIKQELKQRSQPDASGATPAPKPTPYNF